KELLHRGDVEDGDGVAAEAVLGHPEDAVVADVEAASVGGERGFMREAADLYTPEFPDIFAVKRDGAGDLLDDREVRLLLRRGDGAGSEQDPDAAETGACHATEGHYPPKTRSGSVPGEGRSRFACCKGRRLEQEPQAHLEPAGVVVHNRGADLALTHAHRGLCASYSDIRCGAQQEGGPTQGPRRGT